MPVRGNCTICTDYFNCDQDISVTFCGHLFHNGCLNQWLTQSAQRKTCPQCRTKLTAKQVVQKLYINVPESNDDLDPYELKNTLNETEAKLSKLKLKRSELEDHVKNLDERQKKLEKKLSTTVKNLKHEMSTAEVLRNELKNAKLSEKEYISAQNDVKILKERLKTCSKVDIILDGQKEEVDEMLQIQINTSTAFLFNELRYMTGNQVSPSLRQLATFCVALKQEFENLKQSRNRAKDDAMKAKKELHQANQQLQQKTAQCEEMDESLTALRKTEEQLTDENQGLRRKIKALMGAISSPSDTRSSAISRLISESPAPMFLTPVVNGQSGSKQKRCIREEENVLAIKKPRLSISTSFNSEDMVDLDSDEGTSNPTNNSKQLKSPKRCLPKHTTASITETDSPDTKNRKAVCSEFGLKYVKTTQKGNQSGHKIQPNIYHRKPLVSRENNSSDSSGSLVTRVGYNGMGGHTVHLISSKRTKKVPMSSKAKPFTSKPVPTSTLKFKYQNTIKIGKR